MLTRGNQLEVSLLSGRAEKTIKKFMRAFPFVLVLFVTFFLAHWDEKCIKIPTAPPEPGFNAGLFLLKARSELIITLQCKAP